MHTTRPFGHYWDSATSAIHTQTVCRVCCAPDHAGLFGSEAAELRKPVTRMSSTFFTGSLLVKMSRTIQRATNFEWQTTFSDAPFQRLQDGNKHAYEAISIYLTHLKILECMFMDTIAMNSLAFTFMDRFVAFYRNCSALQTRKRNFFSIYCICFEFKNVKIKMFHRHILSPYYSSWLTGFFKLLRLLRENVEEASLRTVTSTPCIPDHSQIRACYYFLNFTNSTVLGDLYEARSSHYVILSYLPTCFVPPGSVTLLNVLFWDLRILHSKWHFTFSIKTK